MPPLVKAPVSRTTLVDDGASESPFSRAIDEFLVEMKQNDHEKNPFVKELTQQQARLVKTSDKTTQSQVSAETLRSFVAQLDSQKRAGRGPRILARVGPFIDGLQKLMLACETVVQASPFGVNIAFAGARIVLELASKLQTYLDSVVDAMEYIATSLKCYEKFAYAYESSTDIQGLLVRAYKKIIEFWCNVSRTLSQNSFKAVFKSIAKPLDKDIKTALEGLRQIECQVQSLAQSTADSQRRRDREKAQRQGIVSWIMPVEERVDVRVDLQDQLDRRQDGTCQWMFEDDRFKKWRGATERSVLWYNAAPGSGKTVFASTIVEHLTQEGEDVAYFFYSFNNPLRHHGIKGLRSLALQLLTRLETLPDVLVNRYENEMRNQAGTLEVPRIAAHVINELVSQCDQAYIVIDGLDECKDEMPTLDALLHLVQMPTYGVVKWLFTSRDHPVIRAVMEKCKAVEIQPQKGSISKDIRTYFSEHIDCQSCIDGWTEDEENFLYARLVCETLQGQGLTCDEEIQEALDEFPKGLNGYYLRSLEKLSEKSETQQELAR